MTHVDDTLHPADPLDSDTVAWLDARFGVPPPAHTRPTAVERAAIRARVLGTPAPAPSSRATGIVAGSPVAFPAAARVGMRRVASLAAAAVLVLILAATLGAYLRTDDGERLPGAAATASVLPFAPGAALASPAAASPDRTKVLLDRAGSAAEDTSLWIDLDTDEVRELPGQPSRLFTESIPGIAGPIGRYVLIDDLQETVRVVDMVAGEVIASEARGDTPLVTVSADGSTLLIPSETAIEIWKPAASDMVTFPVPDGVEQPPFLFSLSPNGACAAGVWDLEGDAIRTVLLPFVGGEPIVLPASGVGGWVASGDP